MKKKIIVLLACLVCALCAGCGSEQAAEPEPVGSVYQIWLSDEWRPCYLHWLPEGDLLVGSVEPYGEDRSLLCYMETLDLAEGRDIGAVTVSNLSSNWFYDVRTVEDAAGGTVYLYQSREPDSALFACGADSEMACIEPGDVVEGNQWAYMGQLRTEGRWCDIVLEIAPGQLWQTPIEFRSPKFGEPVLLVEDERIGPGEVDDDRPGGMIAYDISPDMRLYAQLSYDGWLTVADLASGEVAAWWLEPPEVLVGYGDLRFLPDNRTLAVTVLCENRSVAQVWSVDLGAEPQLLVEIDGEPAEDLVLLAAVDADRLLLNCDETRVKLFNWRTGEVEKLYDAGEYLKLRWGCKYLAAPEDLHVLLDPERTRGYVQTAAYEPSSGRLAVIKYFPKENISQLIVLDNWR